MINLSPNSSNSSRRDWAELNALYGRLPEVSRLITMVHMEPGFFSLHELHIQAGKALHEAVFYEIRAIRGKPPFKDIVRGINSPHPQFEGIPDFVLEADDGALWVLDMTTTVNRGKARRKYGANAVDALYESFTIFD